jgi:UDP-2-acetamido-3-amino-2,3-dideoxy-glucuronate N-acetyltransferase
MNKKYNYKDVFVHETSFIDENVIIKQGTKIWHFNHILKNCKIGKDCSFGQNVVVGPNVIIGNKVKIQNNVSVYDGVTLEDAVFCGPSCVFTNVHNPRSEIERKHEYRKTLVKKGATLGANCTIVCGVTIGKFAFIGAGAVISKDVPDYALMVGVPAKQVGWMSEYGHKLDLPVTGNAKTICKHSSKVYELKDDKVILKD